MKGLRLVTYHYLHFWIIS